MSPPPISIEEARARVLEAVVVLDAEEVPVAEAGGRVLATERRALHDVPPFDNSAMDGYAVLAGAATALEVAGESRAGSPAIDVLGPGAAIPISTGAALPAGADAVAPVENTVRDGDLVTLTRAPAAGENVRRAGEDMRAGEVVLSAGTRIGAAEIGVAIAAGAGALRCARRPRVAIVATGDELRAAGQPLGPGEIHDSNAATLGELARRAGAVVCESAHAGDDLEQTRELLEHALEQADVVIAAGGVSVGTHDHVKPALAALGVDECFWRIALRPGGPTWFGTRDDRLVFGLPGNPVSAMVTFSLFAAPALRALQGADPAPRTLAARLAEPQRRRRDRTEALRVSLTQQGAELWAHRTGAQGSHVTRSMLGADGLALIEPGDGVAAAGETVTVIGL